uniref:Uncharacterized protein n=1 Tax=Panagrolaimus sp. PS1159 TaxID=55785 RepID=A0AC35GD40_9BILA
MEVQNRINHDSQSMAQLINEVREIKDIMLIQSQLEAYQAKVLDLSQKVTEQSKAITRKDYEITLLKAEVDLLTQGIRNNEYVIGWMDNLDDNNTLKSEKRLARYKYRIFNFFKSIA